MLRNYIVIATLMVGGILQANNPLLSNQQFSNAMKNPLGNTMIKTAAYVVTKDMVGKDALVEKKILGVPVLTTQEATEVAVDAAYIAAKTQDPKEATKAATASFLAAKATSYLSLACEYTGLTLSEEFIAQHPDLANTVTSLTQGITRFALRTWIAGAIDDALSSN